jgi:hypothetical protein
MRDFVRIGPAASLKAKAQSVRLILIRTDPWFYPDISLFTRRRFVNGQGQKACIAKQLIVGLEAA